MREVKRKAAPKSNVHSTPLNLESFHIARMQRDLKKLRDQVVEYENAEAIRVAQHEEYYKLANLIEQISGSAERSNLSTEKLEVNWLYSSSEECRRAKIVIPDEWTKPKVFAMSDQQLGHNTCDVTRLKKDIAWAARDRQTLVVLIGDSIDSATAISVGSARDNKEMGPLRQIEEFVKMHEPINGQVVGIVGGNHERRIDKALAEPGAAIRLIARGLSGGRSEPVPYSSGILLLDFHWRGHKWTFTLFHGTGAAQTPGAKINRMHRNMLLTDSLITISGHLHDENKTSRRFVRRIDSGEIKIVKQTALQCGSYLRWLGSYAEVFGMAPTGPDMVVIEFFPDGRYIDRFKGESDS